MSKYKTTIESILLTEENQYLDLLFHILHNGKEKEDRTGTGTIGIFGASMRFDLSNNVIPLLTTKKMNWNSIIEELCWFIRGETNSKLLESKNVNIWKGNTSKEFLSNRNLPWPEGEIGPSYRISMEKLEW